MKNLLLLLVVGLITGCTAVTSSNPVGTEAVKLDSQKWNGVWSDGGEVVYFVKVKDAEKGILHIGYVDEEDDKFEFNTFDAEIKSAGNDNFCNIKVAQVTDENELKELPESLKKSFYWVMINNEKNKLTIMLPEPNKIKTLGKESGIDVKKVKDSLLVDASSEDISKFIQKYKNGELYIWKHPIVLQRIIKK